MQPISHQVSSTTINNEFLKLNSNANLIPHHSLNRDNGFVSMMKKDEDSSTNYAGINNDNPKFSLLLNKVSNVAIKNGNIESLMINKNLKNINDSTMSIRNFINITRNNENLSKLKPRWSSFQRSNLSRNSNSSLSEINKSLFEENTGKNLAGSRRKNKSTAIVNDHQIDKNKYKDDDIRYIRGGRSIYDPNYIIGSYKELNKPRDFIHENTEKIRKVRKSKQHKQYELDDDKQSLFDIMSIENAVDGYYGDWKRDEFILTRSRHKIKNLAELKPIKSFSKIFSQLPSGYIRTKIENGRSRHNPERLKSSNSTNYEVNVNSSPKKIIKEKSLPKKEYSSKRRLAEYNASKTTTVALDEEIEKFKKEDEWKSNIYKFN